IAATNTEDRIKIIDAFLLERLKAEATIDKIVKTTVDALLASNGNKPISEILKNNPSKRRQLERKFKKQVGVSPKQLGRMIRLQTALKLMLNEQSDKLTNIAYQCEYYDQAHFIKDFKAFTGISPADFQDNEKMTLSAIFYK
ncbi:MAG: helix-turn-helix domain-containing protein, partial [Bacteroidota bacterium]